MKLRFAINQGEALRRGIDAPNSIHTLDVDPQRLPQATRSMIADRLRLHDIRVYRKGMVPALDDKEPTYARMLTAVTPDWTGFLQALEEDERGTVVPMKEAQL